MNNELDRESYTPLYVQVQEIIKKKIENGEYEVGKKVPSETQLQKKLSISRTTARNALQELVNEGILESKQGKGTYVRRKKLNYQLTRLTSFTEDIKNKGLNPDTEVLKKELITPGDFVLNKLNLNQGEKTYYLKRLMKIDKEVVGVHEAYLNEKLLKDKGFLNYNFSDNSLYSVLRNEYNIILGEANETIEAAPADNYTSKLLNIDESFPVLILNRLTYTEKGELLEYCKIIYRADRYKYNVKLERK
ncbi:MAG: GntR family transcriptional regulator [Bacillota bacterium]